MSKTLGYSNSKGFIESDGTPFRLKQGENGVLKRLATIPVYIDIIEEHYNASGYATLGCTSNKTFNERDTFEYQGETAEFLGYNEDRETFNISVATGGVINSAVGTTIYLDEYLDEEVIIPQKKLIWEGRTSICSQTSEFVEILSGLDQTKVYEVEIYGADGSLKYYKFKKKASFIDYVDVGKYLFGTNVYKDCIGKGNVVLEISSGVLRARYDILDWNANNSAWEYDTQASNYQNIKIQKVYEIIE